MEKKIQQIKNEINYIKFIHNETNYVKCIHNEIYLYLKIIVNYQKQNPKILSFYCNKYVIFITSDKDYFNIQKNDIVKHRIYIYKVIHNNNILFICNYESNLELNKIYNINIFSHTNNETKYNTTKYNITNNISNYLTLKKYMDNLNDYIEMQNYSITTFNINSIIEFQQIKLSIITVHSFINRKNSIILPPELWTLIFNDYFKE